MKRVLQEVIDHRKSVFLIGRELLHSVLVANKAMNEAKRRRKYLNFKVDFEKAYHSVSREFLFYVLHRLGFHDMWIKWIKGCLESSWASKLVNKILSKKYNGYKGLRLGDPLALFLFLVVMEDLNGLMRKAKG